MNTKTMESGRNFNIRKATNKAKTIQQMMDQQYVANLEDLRLTENQDYDRQKPRKAMQATVNPADYAGDEQNINCYRFPHSNFCGCQPNCLLESFETIQIIPGLYLGNFVTGLKGKHMLDLGITHVLNVTCKAFTKREKYFKYEDIDLRNTTQEDAKKFFRLSNRFVKSALESGGKVFIHCSELQMGAMMGCAFMISSLKISLKQCLQKLAPLNIEISPHFLKQLQAYDLYKMAFVSIQRQ